MHDAGHSNKKLYYLERALDVFNRGKPKTMNQLAQGTEAFSLQVRASYELQRRATPPKRVVCHPPHGAFGLFHCGTKMLV